MSMVSTAIKRARPLTEGEIAMARLIFGDAIDYSKVAVHNHGYLPFGLQRKNVAMAPNGKIYFGSRHFRDDFSCESNRNKHWFMHEMVHVWQHQLGYPVRLRGAIRIGLSYAYVLAADKRLGDFNMEAQGDLLADYFALKYLQDAGAMQQCQYCGDLKLYEQVLGTFLADPKTGISLPRRRRTVWV
jgi:hypothetical protein